MRLLSAHVVNYRVHRDRTVEFDAARTLVGGPNESGKSTLAEAIHRALFLRHSVGGATLDAMRPSSGSGLPEVTLRFEAGGRTYTLHKRFAGARGSTALLTDDAGGAWRDDEAETRLSALLGVEEAAGGRSAAGQLQGQWAHLLAWQGDSPADPLEASEGQHARLLQRLQGEQGAVVQQSPLDARVAGEVERLLGEHVTERGSRAGGPLHAADKHEQECRATRAKAEGELAVHARALEEFTEAERDLRAAQASLAGLQPQVDALALRQAEVDRLRPIEQEAARLCTGHAGELARLEGVEQAIAQRRVRVRSLGEELAPRAQQAQASLDALSRVEAERGTAAERVAEARRGLEAAQAREALARARLDELQGAQRVAGLEKQQQALEAHAARVDALERARAALAPVLPKHLRELERHAQALAAAQAALGAMAAGIEVLEAPGAVRVGAEEVAAGGARTVTEPTEVQVPGGVRLRIHPGGGEALAKARAQVQAAELDGRALLGKLGVASREQAVQVAEERTRLDAQLEQLQLSRPDAQGEGQELAQQLTRARQAWLEAQAEVARRAAALRAGEALPDSLSQAEAWQRACKDELAAAQAAERRAQAQLEQQDDTAAAARTRLGQAEAALGGAKEQLRNEQAVLEHELHTHGDDVARAQRLAEARGQAGQAQARLEAVRAELAGHQPDTLEADRTRLGRARDAQEQRRLQASERRLRSEGALREDGRRDLEAAASMARAAHEAAQAARARVQRRVEALGLLARSFAEHRQQVVAQYTRPLVEQVQRYARCVFGSRALPGLSWDEDKGAFAGLRLEREAAAHAFDALSMGAREQLGVAVRLAIAKVLAAEHGGCLPVVLDDAFSHSDEGRVEGLLQMLDLAAQDGLQVIVLTCRPASYAALGARQVDLPRGAPGQAGVAAAPVAPASDQPGGSPADAGVREAAAPASVAGSDVQALLDALRDEGGSAGNGRLRTRLGWDDARYAAARQAALASGRVVPAAGRGGSLRLVP